MAETARRPAVKAERKAIIVEQDFLGIGAGRSQGQQRGGEAKWQPEVAGAGAGGRAKMTQWW